VLSLSGLWDSLEVRKRQGEILAHPSFNKDMLELTMAIMLWGQTSHLSADQSSWGGPALRASPGAQAAHVSLLCPFMACVSSDRHR